jgi:hypothetical protein
MEEETDCGRTDKGAIPKTVVMMFSWMKAI